MSQLPVLVIGNKNYSSWSLRPWLLLRQFGVDFEERRLPLDTEQFQQEIGRWSPTRRVPVLHHDGLIVWDSLAIAEYANEVFLDGRGWPQERKQRAIARCAAAEMHSGFAALRQQLPMNCGRKPGNPHWDSDAEHDIQRVRELWAGLLGKSGERRFLCGEFGIVDAMYAPVVMRFHGYGVPLDGVLSGYVERMLGLPGMLAWQSAAAREGERLAKYESIGK